MTWTLAQAAANEKDPFRRGVLMTFWMESNLMAAIPWETVNRLALEMRRVARLSLTKPTWMTINGTYANATVDFDALTEAVHKMGGHVDIPRDLASLDGQFEDPVTLNIEARLKAMAFETNEAMINGPNVGGTTGAPDANAPTGLMVRIDQIAALAGLSDAKTAVGANGTPFASTASSANRHAVLDGLDAAMYFIDGHQPDWGAANDTFLKTLNSALRREGTLFAQTRDQFGRWVNEYRGVPIYDAGLKVDQQNRIIGNAEVQGTSSDATSVYFVKNGVASHFHGFEKEPLSTRDLGELQTEATLRTRIDWLIGWANWHTRCLARVTGIRATT